MAIDALSDALLDDILNRALVEEPKIASTLLSVSPRFRHSCLRLLFHTITIPDDARHLPNVHGSVELSLSSAALIALVSEPDVYGVYVTTLKVVDPVVLSSNDAAHTATLFQMDEEQDPAGDNSAQNGPAPLSSLLLRRWLHNMPNLEHLLWTSGALPPDGLCETVATYCKSLRTFSYAPSPSILPAPVEKGTLAAARSGPMKWDAPSLPHLSQLTYLSSLSVSRLSREGSSALSHLLRLIASGTAPLPPAQEEPGLERLEIDVLWLDEELCNAIAEVGSSNRKLKTLCLGTQGTKLRDKLLDKVFEGCEHLENLKLREVEGRLSRTYWSTASLPSNLDALSVSLSESGPHHSWVSDHLQSLSCLPLNTLRSVHITRGRSPVRLLDREPAYDEVGRGPGNTVPVELVVALKGGQLRELECDWWLWRVEDVKMLVDDCVFLQSLKLAFDAPFTKVFTLISSLASLSMLRTIALSIPVQHAPLLPSPSASQAYLPPSPTMPYTPLTPSTSPIKAGSYSASRNIEPPTPPVETSSLGGLVLNDPALPPLRDIKKLARRCDRLQVLEWYGHNARGSWHIEHEPSLKVFYSEPPRAPACISERLRWEQEAAVLGWKPAKRDGQSWLRSEWLHEEQEREKERELEKALEKVREDERTKAKEKEKESKSKEAEKKKTVTPNETPKSPISPQSANEGPESPRSTNFPLPSATLSKSPGGNKRHPRRIVSDSVGGPPKDGHTRGPSSRSNGRGRGSGAPTSRSVSASASGNDPNRKPGGGGRSGGGGRHSGGDRPRGTPRSPGTRGGAGGSRGRGSVATH